MLATGATIADAPDIAGELTPWHDGMAWCWEEERIVGVPREDASCPRGESRPTAPMLHVWLVPQDGGPFADAGHGSGTGTGEHTGH